MIKPVRVSSKTLTEVAEMELRKAIQGGEYQPGSQLPSEAELIDMLGVSRTTVREALRSLEQAGMIIRRHGVGTFVLERPLIYNFALNFGITEMIKSANMTPGTSELKIYEEPASEDVAEQLGIERGEMVKVIERVRTANKNPVVFSVDYLPLTIFEGKDLTKELSRTLSIYDFLQSEYNLIIEYGVAKIMPVNASKEIAEKLEQKRNAILLLITQTDFLANDKPVLHTYEYNLPNAFNYQFLRRRPSTI